jgi:hypothetical protein
MRTRGYVAPAIATYGIAHRVGLVGDLPGADDAFKSLDQHPVDIIVHDGQLDSVPGIAGCKRLERPRGLRGYAQCGLTTGLLLQQRAKLGSAHVGGTAGLHLRRNARDRTTKAYAVVTLDLWWILWRILIGFSGGF